jgi:tetratricopeptide (TPR) repeat protein
VELWDFESWQAIAARQVQVARDAAALVHLQFALNSLGHSHLLAGELAVAERLIEEDRLIGEATGNPPVAYAAMLLAAWQGRPQQAAELIQATVQNATGRGTGRLVGFAAYASAVLYNGLGRYDAARDAVREVFQRDELAFGHLVVAELAEAAARTGEVTLVQTVLDWLSERTRVTPTEWVLGIEARIRALLSDGQAADSSYQESIQRLGRTKVRSQLARSHLLYGEWLRRQSRRVEAREQLRTAHQMLEEMGMAAFAQRADRPGGPGGAAGPGRAVQPGDRHPAVHQPAHRPVPPQQRLRQARHHLPKPAPPGTARRPGYRRAALASAPPWSWPLSPGCFRRET